LPELNIDEVMFNMCERTAAASGGQAEVSICRWRAASGYNSGKIAEGTAVAIKHLQFPLGGRNWQIWPPKDSRGV
jgi:hypothetical protein